MKRDVGHDTPESGTQFFHQRFDDPEAFSKRFDAAERDKWQKPGEVIESFQLADDATVAEIGAGTGYFTVRLAKLLKKGKVIGLDSEPKMVEYLRKRAEKLGLTNVDARLVQVGEKVDLNEKVDLVLCVETYHHISDRVLHFSSYIKSLNMGGKLVIIDHKASSPIGPPAKHRIPPETVKEEMKEAGFVPVNDMDFLPYQFHIVFEPAESGHTPK